MIHGKRVPTGLSLDIMSIPEHLFTPVTIQDCPVDARTLQFDRTTFLTYKDGTTQTLKDNWMSNEGHRAMTKSWTGETHFFPIRSDESAIAPPVSQGNIVPGGLKRPSMPMLLALDHERLPSRLTT